jgi:hypothetical protein
MLIQAGMAIDGFVGIDIDLHTLAPLLLNCETILLLFDLGSR